ncbi:MAG: hypothetical protein IKW32_08400 [Bacteroidaceae bacterium]|nr:hypothetical protein [Bacteroidaceae bacterium]
MTLYTEQQKKVYITDKPLGSGGEGAVYALDPRSEIPDTDKLVAKIYEGCFGKRLKLEYLQTVLADTVRHISFPYELLYDKNGKCKGFVMKRVTGVSLYETAFIPKLVKILGWNRVDLTILARRILERFIELHQVGVLMGDINPFNILVDQEKLLPYFIDVDSYQTYNEPCTVYTEEFLSPRLTEIVGGSEAFLRDMEDEYYAITVLLFKIFLVGKNPYARSGDGSLQAHIKQRDFVFPRGYDNNQNMPRGPWQRIWYNMPERMRSAFYEAFHDGIYRKPAEWRDIVIDYENGLREGTYPMVIFPKGENVGLGKHLLSMNFLKVGNNNKLRKFYNDRGCIGNQKKNYAVVEFGTNSIRCFENRTNARAGLFIVPTRHFLCVDENGMMDITQLERKLDEQKDRWSLWNNYIGGIRPAVNSIHAFGGSLLRNLTNREEVLALLERKLGITFGIYEMEEEVKMLADYANKYRNMNHSMMMLDVSGAAMLYCYQKQEKTKGFSHEYDKLGSKLLIGWFFSTSSEDTRLETKLHEHDLAVEEKINKIRTRENGSMIMAFGVIREIRKEKYKQEPEKWSLVKLKEYCNKLTEDLTCNRQLVNQIYNEFYHSDMLARKFELRLSLTVYIKLMEKVKADSLLIMPVGTGEVCMKKQMKQI